jgi:predicted kinase
MMQGLPGAGKSRVAEHIVLSTPRTVRISKDSLRHMLYFISRPKEDSQNPTSPSKEQQIEHLEYVLLHVLLSQGLSVVVDDTNLDPERIRNLQAVAKLGDNRFELVPVHASISECIRNDARRTPPAGEAVIRAYAQRWREHHPWIAD